MSLRFPWFCPVSRKDVVASDEDDDSSRRVKTEGRETEHGEIKVCTICYAEDLTLEDQRERVASGCTHTERSVCDSCLRRHIAEEVNGKGQVLNIRCPVANCGAGLEFYDVQRLATAAVFERYDTLLTGQLLQKMREFRWCSAGCGSGQLHASVDRVPIMRCHHCHARTCYTHRCAWHQGRTCAQYDEDAAHSEEVALIQRMETVERCPKCGQGIEKNGGCDHMTCRKEAKGCGHEFCWRCKETYRRRSNGSVDNTFHKSSCIHHPEYRRRTSSTA